MNKIIQDKIKLFREKFDELYKYKPDFSPENDDEWIEVSKDLEQWLSSTLAEVYREGYQVAMKTKFSIKRKEYNLASPYKRRISQLSKRGGKEDL